MRKNHPCHTQSSFHLFVHVRPYEDIFAQVLHCEVKLNLLDCHARHVSLLFFDAWHLDGAEGLGVVRRSSDIRSITSPSSLAVPSSIPPAPSLPASLVVVSRRSSSSSSSRSPSPSSWLAPVVRRARRSSSPQPCPVSTGALLAFSLGCVCDCFYEGPFHGCRSRFGVPRTAATHVVALSMWSVVTPLRSCTTISVLRETKPTKNRYPVDSVDSTAVPTTDGFRQKNVARPKRPSSGLRTGLFVPF